MYVGFEDVRLRALGGLQGAEAFSEFRVCSQLLRPHSVLGVGLVGLQGRNPINLNPKP